MNRTIIYSGIVLVVILVSILAWLVWPRTSLTLDNPEVQDWKVGISGTARRIKAVRFEVVTPNGDSKAPIPPVVITDDKFNQSVPLFDESMLYNEHQQLASGNYTLIVISTADDTQRAQKTVTVQMPPEPTIEITKATPQAIMGTTDPKVRVSADITGAEIPTDGDGGFQLTAIPPGTRQVTITAVNWAGKKTEQVIQIEELKLTTSLRTAEYEVELGNPVTFTTRITGGNPPYEYAVEGLPEDAKWNTDTGEFKWAEPSAGEYSATLTVKDATGQKATAPLRILVVNRLRIISPRPNQEFLAKVGNPVNFPVQATGGSPPYGHSAQPLPPGATLDPLTGEFTWTQTRQGNYTVRLVVTDTESQKAAVTVRVNIFPDVPQVKITYPSPRQELPEEIVYAGQPIRFTVEAEGGEPSYGYSADGLPVGATLNPSTGEFEWLQAAAGEYPVTVKVNDKKGAQATVPFTIKVSDPGDIVMKLEPYPVATQAQQVTLTGQIEYLMPENLDGIRLDPDGRFQQTVELQEGENIVTFLVSDRTNPAKRVEKTIVIIRDTDQPYFLYDDEPTTVVKYREDETTPVLVTAVDSTSPLASLSASWGSVPQPDGKEHQVEIDVSLLPEYDNQLIAEDMAGNRAELKLRKDVNPIIDLIDSVPTNKDSYVVRGTVTRAYGEISVTVGDETVTLPDGGSFSITVPLPNEGENRITILAVDALGGRGQTDITVVRDTQKPVFTQAGQEVELIDVLIEEMDERQFTIDIVDEGGIDTVTLNEKPIAPEIGQSWVIPLTALKVEEDGNLVGRLIARDLAGNEAELPITARTPPSTLRIRVEEEIQAGRYGAAWKTLNELEKRQGLNASVKLFRGIIAYRHQLQMKDVLAAYKILDEGAEDAPVGAIGHGKGVIPLLEQALAEGAETYPEDSDNLHYNRYYLGMSYYKQHTLAKQIGLDDSVIQQKRRRAIEHLESFTRNVGDRMPTYKQEAMSVLTSLQ